MLRTLAVVGAMAVVLGLVPGRATAEEARAREGKVRGTVITVGEDRVVIQKAEEGGQMTLEPRWLGGGRGRDKEQIAYFHTLKQGDKVEATWKLDEGTHYCVQSITKLDADGRPIRADEGKAEPGQEKPVAVQIHELRAEVTALRQEIMALREMLAKALQK